MRKWKEVSRRVVPYIVVSIAWDLTLQQKLRRVILDDELGICDDLEKDMEELVGTYYDEWKAVVDDPERQKQFRQFVNTNERCVPVEQVVERGQPRPANWAKAFPPACLTEDRIGVSKD